MKEYKDKYIFKYERDEDGLIYNRQDNYISCRSKGKIYRYFKDVLIFESPKKIRTVIKDEDGNIIKDWTPLLLKVWDTPMEREIYFKEENLEQLEDLFKIRKRKKRNLTEEQKEELRKRLAEARNKGETEDDIEEELDDVDDEEGDEVED